VIGEQQFVQSFIESKVTDWVGEVEKLAKIAECQPQAAYAVFTHGLCSRWSYLSRTLEGLESQLQPLENAIRNRLVPSLTGKNAISEDERTLLSLPVRLGGMGIPIPTKASRKQYDASRRVTAAVIQKIEDPLREMNAQDQTTIFQAIHKENRQSVGEEAMVLKESLQPSQRRAMEQASERGASSWLTAIPISEFGFRLHKEAFRDALCIRYGWTPKHLPSHCVCGNTFTVSHAFSCPKGGLPSIRHDDIRDTMAQFLTEVCSNVAVEPQLQALSGETFTHRTANIEQGARLDIKAMNFWDKCNQSAFFDVRVFNSFAPSNCTSSTIACYRRHEKEKRREYERRIIDVEHGTFCPIVLSSSGGWGPSASIAFKRLARLISIKRNESYHQVMRFIRLKISFSLVRSAHRCLRGSRAAFLRPVFSNPVELVSSEAQIQD
jgi:hypothetical protein